MHVDASHFGSLTGIDWYVVYLCFITVIPSNRDLGIQNEPVKMAINPREGVRNFLFGRSKRTLLHAFFCNLHFFL